MKTETRVTQWGNSLGVRIPKGIAERAGVSQEELVEIEAEKGKITLTRVSKKRLTIDERIAAITPENLNRDEEWLNMPPVGKEVW